MQQLTGFPHVVQGTAETQHAYRELLFTTPGIGAFLSGVVWFDETIKQAAYDATSFPKVLTR